MRQNYSFSKNGNALLEPCEGKLSCTVLRGESPSNGADLLDKERDGNSFCPSLRNMLFTYTYLFYRSNLVKSIEFFFLSSASKLAR